MYLQHYLVNHSAWGLFFFGLDGRTLRPVVTQHLSRNLIPLDLRRIAMTNKILVTGASGTIGSHLVRELLAAKADFAVLTSKPGQAKAGVDTRVASFEDEAALKSAFQGIDTLYLLLPLVPNKLALARNAVAAAKAAGIKHIVRSSGAGADAASPYALPRLQGEIDAVIAASGIAHTFLRPAGFMQNFITFQAQQVKEGTFFAPHGDAKQSIIDARDIAAVAARVLLNPAAHAGKTYTLTGGESFDHKVAAAQLSVAIGKPVRYQAVSFDDAVAGMKQWNLPPMIIEVMDSLNHIVAAGYAADISGDVEKLLGRKPITFAQFAKDHAAAWR
jgi:uncharacterized protein YbjT (DUF2867 family)